MKEIAHLLRQILLLLIQLTGLVLKYIWTAITLIASYLYRHRSQIIHYKYTPVIALTVSTVWFFFNQQTHSQTRIQSPQEVAHLVSYEKKGTDAEWIAEYVEMTGMLPDKKSNPKLIHSIYDWLGAPQHDGGNTKAGTDCSGFVQAVFDEALDMELSRNSQQMYEADTREIEREELKEGDLVFFRVNSGSISHVGIYLKEGLFVHASTSKGVCVNSLDELYYRKTFYSGGRVKEWKTL